MKSFRQIYYHIVFGTKNREPVIADEYCMDLYKYVWGIVNKLNCKLYQINGTEDHIHLLTDLHPSISLAFFIREIKVASNEWMKNSGRFPMFVSWQEGHGAFTLSRHEKEMIRNYIKKQKEHHLHETFYDEFKRLLKENDIVFDEKYLL